jgi:hypothetical protein
MSRSLGIGGDLVRWSAEELDEARELVSAYKSVRHIVQLGRLHRLASTRHGPLGAVQYVDVATGAERSGAELIRFGPELPGPLDFGSVFLHLKRLPAGQS